MLPSFTALLHTQLTIFCSHVSLFCVNLKPVSLSRAVQTLWFKGLVSHPGQSRHSLPCLIIKPSAQAHQADAVAVLCQ